MTSPTAAATTLVLLRRTHRWARVLRTLAHSLANVARRPLYAVGRVGGDEFEGVWYAPDTDWFLAGRFLDLRFDQAHAILLLNVEGLSEHPLAFHENAERSGIDALRLGGTLLVGGVGHSESCKG